MPSLALAKSRVLANVAGLASAGSGDPFSDQVSLLVYGDHLVNPVDESKNAASATIDNVVVDGGELLAGGAGGKVAFASSAAFAFPLEFTLEFDITASEAELYATYFMARNAMNYFNCASNGVAPDLTVAYSSLIDWPANMLPAFDTRYRMAFSRDADGVRRAFRDGVRIHVGSASTETLTAAAFDLFGVPGRADLTTFRGKLSYVRLTQGVCRYVDNYDPSITFPRR